MPILTTAPGLWWLDNPIFYGPQIIAWFLLFACLIILIAKFLTKSLEIISARVKISKAFLGGIIMSLVVSLPELVASIFGGIEGTPMYSLYNETGSNMMQVFLLSIIMLIFFVIEFSKHKVSKNKSKYFESETYKKCFVEMSQSNRVVLISMAVIYFLFLLFILVPPIGKYLYIPGINVSIVSFIPFLIWIGFGIWAITKKNNIEVNHKLTQHWMYKWNLFYLWIFFILLACCLIVIAYINSGIVEQFTPIFNIPEQTSATILLSFATSLPEIVSLIFLCIAKDYYLGLSTITGGALVNASFVFYTDCIVPGPTFKLFHEQYLTPDNSQYLDAYRMQYWIIIVFIITFLMYLTSIRKFSKNKVCMTVNLTSIMIVYLAGFILISTIVIPPSI